MIINNNDDDDDVDPVAVKFNSGRLYSTYLSTRILLPVSTLGLCVGSSTFAKDGCFKDDRLGFGVGRSQ